MPVGRRVLLAEDDVALSEMLDVVDWLRNDGDFTPVILITSFPQDDIRKRAGALGLRLLAKPFELEALCAAVDWAIRAHAPHS